jgi:hypothetical protein
LRVSVSNELRERMVRFLTHAAEPAGSDAAHARDALERAIEAGAWVLAETHCMPHTGEN